MERPSSSHEPTLTHVTLHFFSSLICSSLSMKRVLMKAFSFMCVRRGQYWVRLSNSVSKTSLVSGRSEMGKVNEDEEAINTSTFLTKVYCKNTLPLLFFEVTLTQYMKKLKISASCFLIGFSKEALDLLTVMEWCLQGHEQRNLPGNFTHIYARSS